MSQQKVPVTFRAVVQRVNRTLAKDGTQLRAARGEAARRECGDYYIVDLSRNALKHAHVDLEKLARKLGALQGHERVVWE